MEIERERQSFRIVPKGGGFQKNEVVKSSLDPARALDFVGAARHRSRRPAKRPNAKGPTMSKELKEFIPLNEAIERAVEMGMKRRAAMRLMAKALRSGEVQARGIPPEKTKHEMIEPEFWQRAKFETDKDN
jgi:hypothetical protein